MRSPTATAAFALLMLVAAGCGGSSSSPGSDGGGGGGSADSGGGGCGGDGDCSGGQICDDATHECRDCVDMTEDDRCGEGAACVGGACTAGACNIDDQCAAPNLCLDHQCGCTSDTTCDGGLCTDGVCAECTDPDDDDACQSAYGGGFLCIAGTCKVASCRGDGECGGEICCDNTCTSNDCCGSDDDTHCDAVAAGFVCNATGQCVCPDRPAGTVVVSETGDDSVGNGSSACPVRSVTHGLALAAADPSATVTIEIGAGLYSVGASGESFPLLIDRTGVTLTGAGSGASTIRNATASSSLLRIDDAADVSGLTLESTGSSDAVVDVRAGGQLSDIDITGNGSTGSCVVGNAGAAMEVGAGTISNCAVGVRINQDATLTLTGQVQGNSAIGVHVLDGGVVEVLGASISDNPGSGIVADDNAVSNATSIIDTATIAGNGGDGVLVRRNSRLQIRDSIITANGFSGVNAQGASVQLDLGTLADPGGNTLNTTTARNGDVGVCNLTGLTLDAINDTWASCPPSVNPSAACSGGFDINGNIRAANCSAQ